MRNLAIGLFLLLQGAAAAAQGFPVKLTSPAFPNGGSLAKEYTCDGVDKSPPLELSERPTITRSWALVVDDPDAPGGRFIHWVIWNIPGDQRGLDAGQPKDLLRLANGAIQ